MATLLIAAHAHHKEATLPVVSTARMVTAARFATPKNAIARELEASRAPQVAIT